MLEISKGIFLIGVAVDLMSILFLLLFRKPKGRKQTLKLDRKSVRLIGYYMVGSSVLALVISHLVGFLNSNKITMLIKSTATPMRKIPFEISNI